jgi:carboxylate-amine ligase
VEVRVADVCTDLEDALLVAALVRGLVETAVGDSDRDADRWRAEALRASQWRAARYGVSDTLVHPLRREPAPAREVLDALADHVATAVGEAGDAELVADGLDRVSTRSGASRQRAAYERTGGVEGVVDDLIQRTRASWDT